MLLASPVIAATTTNTRSADHGAQETPGKTVFLATLRRALNEELRTLPVQPVAQPVQLSNSPKTWPLPVAQPVQSGKREDDSEEREDEREEAEAEAEAKSARDELQKIEEEARTTASVREQALRNEQNALDKEHAALRATAGNAVAGPSASAVMPPTSATSATAVVQPTVVQPTVVQPAVMQPTVVQPTSATPAFFVPQAVAAANVGTPQTQQSPAAVAATIVAPQQVPVVVAQSSVPAVDVTQSSPGVVASQLSGNASEVDSEKTAQLAAQISKVARWKEAQAAKMMETAKQELARVELDSKQVQQAKEWYASVGQKNSGDGEGCRCGP